MAITEAIYLLEVVLFVIKKICAYHWKGKYLPVVELSILWILELNSLHAGKNVYRLNNVLSNIDISRCIGFFMKLSGVWGAR